MFDSFKPTESLADDSFVFDWTSGDGRSANGSAATIQEAVLAHGGEANNASIEWTYFTGETSGDSPPSNFPRRP